MLEDDGGERTRGAADQAEQHGLQRGAIGHVGQRQRVGCGEGGSFEHPRAQRELLLLQERRGLEDLRGGDRVFAGAGDQREIALGEGALGQLDAALAQRDANQPVAHQAQAQLLRAELTTQGLGLLDRHAARIEQQHALCVAESMVEDSQDHLVDEVRHESAP
jgi:hypothetical protein